MTSAVLPLPIDLLDTQERRSIKDRSIADLRRLFVETFGPDETVTGADGQPVKVADLLQDPDSFDNLLSGKGTDPDSE